MNMFSLLHREAARIWGAGSIKCLSGFSAWQMALNDFLMNTIVATDCLVDWLINCFWSKFVPDVPCNLICRGDLVSPMHVNAPSDAVCTRPAD